MVWLQDEKVLGTHPAQTESGLLDFKWLLNTHKKWHANYCVNIPRSKIG